MADANQDQAEDTRIVFRIGLHSGDLIVDGDDLYGDGVNVAARLEAEAPAGGVVISRTIHEAVTGRLKAAFDDLGSLVLKNIERPVRAFAVRWQPGDWQPAIPDAGAPVAAEPLPADLPLALPDKPSIAVLPFQNMSGDPEQEYFADGMVEDILTALSRTKALFVIARNSSFFYKGKAPDTRQVGRELGVRYVLEGSVRKTGNRVRITGQLIDATSGAHIWADRIDGDLEDIFSLQDEVTSRVVAVIVPTLELAEIARSAVKPTHSMVAYDYSLRGWAWVNEFTREGNRKAIEYFNKAVSLDPKFALAWAQAAGCYVQRKSWNWDDDPASDAEEAERLCRKALQLDRTDPRLLALVGTALGFVVELKEEGLAFLEKATELDPNLSFAWFQRGHACSRLGKPSIAYFEQALRLNPRDFRAPFAQAGLASALIFAGDFARASMLADEALLQLPRHPRSMLVRIAARAHLGEIQEARRTVNAFLAAYPGSTIASVIDRLLPLEHQRVLAEGCRLAGMPE